MSFLPRVLASRQLVRFHSVQTSTLKNALRVATSENGGNHATVGLFINAGSSNDPSGSNGLSNVIGRIASAENRPDTDGAIVSSFVCREKIGFVAHAENGAAAFQALSRAFSSVSQGKDTDARRKEAIAALDSIEMSSRSHVLDHLHSVAFQTTPLAVSTHGTTQGLSSVNSDAVRKYVTTHFTGGRIVVAGTGNVSHKDIVASSEQLLGSLPETSNAFNFATSPKTEYTGSMVLLRDDDLPQVSMALAMRGAEYSNPDYWTLRVIEKIIGQWNRQYGSSFLSSSPLANATIIDEGKVANVLSPFTLSYHSSALIGIYAEATCENAEDTCYHVMKEWIRISETSASTEVEKAKKRLIREVFAASNGSIGLAQNIGSQILNTATYQSPEDIAAVISRITRDNVREAAGKYFIDQDLAVAAVGPTGWFPDYNQLRSWTYWNRL